MPSSGVDILHSKKKMLLNITVHKKTQILSQSHDIKIELIENKENLFLYQN